MKAYNKFLKKIRQINIEAFEYVFINGVRWEKNIDFENLPNTLEKRFFWELESLNEEKLKKLQSDAVNELSLLNDDQLKRCLKRLDLINEFQNFFDFITSFYVKVDDKKHNNLDIIDFKKKLELFFYTKLPNNGEFEIYFLGELIEQLVYKSSILDGLKWQIECLLGHEVEPLSKQNENFSKEQKHPKFNPNLWNNDCFELFKYLYDSYYKSTNRQLTNIWFYLKESNKYNLKATKDNYKEFIFENYQIKLTNFDKAETKWEEKERQTLDEHRINFEDSLK